LVFNKNAIFFNGNWRKSQKGVIVCNIDPQDNDTFNLLYANGLYPVPSMMLHTSTYLTGLLAWHRFRYWAMWFIPFHEFIVSWVNFVLQSDWFYVDSSNEDILNED
jgi:hypothetical protein